MLDLNFQNFIINSVFYDELLDQEESFLMIDVLTNLNYGSPSMRCKLFFAIIALHMDLGELSYKSLFHFGLIVNLSFDCDLDFESLRMWLCPNEASIDNFCSLKSSDFLQEQCEKVFAVSITGDPRRSHISVTKTAIVDQCFFSDT